MTAPFDETDFVDRDLQAEQRARTTTATLPPPGGAPPRAPTREELEAKAGQAQSHLAELKRQQEALERERTTLDEGRRRRQEFETGRAETRDALIRGVGVLEKADFTARRDAEQMAKSLTGFREALTQIEAIHEETWTPENWNTELTRALTTIENARMEWNSARLKHPLLDGDSGTQAGQPAEPDAGVLKGLAGRGFWAVTRLGLALSWPLIAALLIGATVLAIALHR